MTAQREPHLKDLLRFLRAWAAAPLQVAAISPSGTALARLITSEITAAHAPVLELGPGTGVFTQALMDRGLDPRNLTLVEIGADFATHLRARFPGARVLQADAAHLDATGIFPDAEAGAVISGLGLLSMPVHTVEMVVTSAFDCLRQDGHLYQFTYGPRCPVPQEILERLDLRARRIGGTWQNLPPAAVYRISRRTRGQAELETHISRKETLT